MGEARSGETVTTAQHGATEALAGYRDPKPMVFCGLYPVDGDELPDLRDALDKLKLNDASFTFEPESSHALGIGFRCGFLGPAAHGDRARAPRARVRPVAHRHRAERGVPGLPHRRDRARRRQPDRAARRQPHRPHRRADAVGHHHHADRVHRHGDGAVPEPAGRDDPHGVPLARARRARLHDAAGRGGDRLLRPAEEPDQGVRQPRLRAGGLRHRQPGAGRHPDQPHARATPSRPSCTGARPTSTAARWPRSCAS